MNLFFLFLFLFFAFFGIIEIMGNKKANGWESQIPTMRLDGGKKKKENHKRKLFFFLFFFI